MPPAGVSCNRCRQVPPAEGDAWCGACLSWESLGRELAGGWDQAGCRAVAADIVINCTRQIRALRSLGAGISRDHPSAGPGRADLAGASRASGEPLLRAGPREGRASLPRRRSEAPPPPPRLSPRRRTKEEPIERRPEPELDDEESEEEEAGSPDPPVRTRKPDPKDPPPEPELPPREGHHRSSHHRSKADNRRSRERTRDRRDNRSSRRGRERTRSGKKTHRAGRKHQRLARLAKNPLLRIHRKATDSFLSLSTLAQDRTHLERPILPIDG